MSDSYNFYSEDVSKIFPVSFERVNSHDRVLSEENLVDWFRGATADSANLSKNSRYSYVVTDYLNDKFAQDKETITQEFEFILGGYYIRVSDRGVAGIPNVKGKDIYALLEETDDGSFRHLVGGEDINADEILRAVKFITVESGQPLAMNSSPRCYQLHILTEQDGFKIPSDSRRSSYTIDGGEID